MSNRGDDFSDIINGTAGVLEGGGLAGHDSALTEAKPTGVEVQLSCRECGNESNLTVEYGELVAIAHDVSPQAAYGQNLSRAVREPTAWRFSEDSAGWAPDVNCVKCRGTTAPYFTPTEARDHVIKAKASGWIDERALTALSQAAAAARAAGRR